MRARAATLLGGAAGTVALLAAWAAPPLLQQAEFVVFDSFLAFAPRAADPPGGVTVTVVDDASLDRVGRWPWPRDQLALLVDSVREGGASVVALDLLLSEPDTPAGDEALRTSVGRGGVVLSHAPTFAAWGEVGDNLCRIPPVPVVRISGPGMPPPDDHLFPTRGGLCSLPSFTRSASGSGVVTVAPDHDGVLRRLPLLLRTGEDLVASLALAAVLEARSPSVLTLHSAPAGDLRMELDGTVIPLDERGGLAVPFRRGGPGIRQVSAADVLEGRHGPGTFRNQIVFIGATARGVGDRHPTPLGEPITGVELHALLAAGLLDGNLVSTPAWGRLLGVILTPVAGLGVGALVAGLGWLGGGGVGLLVLAAGWAGALGLFASSGTLVSPLLPTLGVGTALGLLVMARMGIERRSTREERARGERTQDFAVHSLTALMETRDSSTGLHARRTGEYVRLIAECLQRSSRFRGYLTEERIRLLARVAPLHDIGKVGVPDAVLNKPGPLTDDEMREIRKHPDLGYQAILLAEEAAGLTGDWTMDAWTLAKDLVRFHHERWDGKGYPHGLSGEEIPVPARIMALVDVYDAMVQTRVYRKAGTHDQARAAIEAGRGTIFDPRVVDAFLEVEEEFRRRTAAHHAGAGD